MKPGAVHRPRDKTIKPEDKTRRSAKTAGNRKRKSLRTAGYRNDTRREDPEEFTDQRYTTTTSILTSFWDLWVIVRTTVIIRVIDPLSYLVQNYLA
jgi:hypothetical protein